ncbi:MAG TPA: hypothetical protein VG797_02000 [Phycisphaerales bacterium]|nr:hypothetical protein [Phycisphaerales bacterium]
MNTLKAIVFPLTTLALAISASAGTITGSYTGDYSKSISITATGHYSGNVSTVQYGWTRSDSPGLGVDASLAITFDTYCIDLDQTVPANSSVIFNVMSLADFGLAPQQSLLLGRLWSTYFPAVDTRDESAAFQAAVWELRYDTDYNLQTGSFKMNNNTDSIRSLAQSWITAINSNAYSGGVTNLVALQSPTKQDQLAAVPVPSAGGVPLAAASALLIVWRRRRSDQPTNRSTNQA